MSDPKYLTLRLSGLSENYLNPTQNQIWNEILIEYKSKIQGSISELLQAIEATQGWQLDLEIKETDIETFAVTMFQLLSKLKKDLESRYFRNTELESGTKFYFIGKAFKEFTKLLHIYQDLIVNKNKFLDMENMKKELKNYYGQYIEPLLLYIKDLLDHSYKVPKKF